MTNSSPPDGFCAADLAQLRSLARSLVSGQEALESLSELLKVPEIAEQHPEFAAAIEAALASSPQGSRMSP